MHTLMVRKGSIGCSGKSPACGRIDLCKIKWRSQNRCTMPNTSRLLVFSKAALYQLCSSNGNGLLSFIITLKGHKFVLRTTSQMTLRMVWHCQRHYKQENIPEGCVPSAAVAVGGRGCLSGGSAHGGPGGIPPPSPLWTE